MRMELSDVITELKKYADNIVNSKVTISPDGLINYDGKIRLNRCPDQKIPFKFGTVTGGFSCDELGLTTLEGCPRIVGGHFTSEFNYIEDLTGGPEVCNGATYSCGGNRHMTSLKGIPKTVLGNFYCTWNPALAILRILTIQPLFAATGKPEVDKIIVKYLYDDSLPVRQKIILCQKELIDSGYKGNAKL